MTDDRHDIAIDTDGKALPMTPADVRQMVLKMIDQGDILAVIVQGPTGDLAVQVFGPPSMETVEILESAAQQLRTAVEHAH